MPSLVSPLGGLPEVVQPGKTGFVASGADAASLRAALRTLVERGWDRDGMRRACLAASSGYSLQRIVGQYEAVLSSAAMHCPVPEQGSGEIWRHPEPESPG